MSIRQLAMAGHGSNLQIRAYTSSNREVILTGVNGDPGSFTYISDGEKYTTNIDKWSKDGTIYIVTTPRGKKLRISTTVQGTTTLREPTRQLTINSTAGITNGPSGSGPRPPPAPTTYRVKTTRDKAIVYFNDPVTKREKETNASDWQFDGSWYWYDATYYTNRI